MERSADGNENSGRLTLPRRARLTHAREFEGVYAAKLRKSRGFLTLFARENRSGLHRLGLAVGKRVGPATARGRMKRLIREAFRLTRGELARPGELHFDVVVSAHAPKTPATLEQCRRALVEGFEELAREWLRRGARRGTRAEGRERGS